MLICSVSFSDFCSAQAYTIFYQFFYGIHRDIRNPLIINLGLFQWSYVKFEYKLN